MTLERAIAVALERNPMMDIAGAGVDRAEAQLDEARGSRLPGLSVSEDVSRTTNPVFVFGQLLGQEAFTVQHFDVNFLNQPDALNNFATRLSLEQPLWTGGRIAGAVGAAKAGRAAAREGRERTRQQVIHQVVDAYSGAVLAEHFLAVAREALATARGHVKLVEDLREAGLVVEADLLRARVRESEVREMVIQAEAGRAVARAALALAMGLPADTALRLPADVAEPPAEDEPLEDLEREALERRPDLRALAHRVEAASAMVRVARGGLWPTIGAGGVWEANAEDAPGTDGTNWTVMLSARFRLFDGGRTRAKIRQAQADVREANAGLAAQRDRVALEIRQAWHALRAARQRLATAREAVRMAEESLRVMEDRYREGLVRLVELQDAETALTGARTREVAARRDVLLGRAALDLAVGRL
ncbi:MAG: TolC family protein [Acidobacteria bacterium]|nr:MAG: TolC family protein [Acidobacteriota bacterium]